MINVSGAVAVADISPRPQPHPTSSSQWMFDSSQTSKLNRCIQINQWETKQNNNQFFIGHFSFPANIVLFGPISIYFLVALANFEILFI